MVIGRSRKGAWIEIVQAHLRQAASSRSRKGAWIEMPLLSLYLVPATVAPVRERGLKFTKILQSADLSTSLP